jgi:transposase, IS30 family
MADARGSLNAVRREFWRGVRAGLSVEEAAAAAGVARCTGKRWVRKAGGMPPLCLQEPSTDHKLALAERESIAHGLASKWSYAAIGVWIGRPTSTVTREVRLNMRHRRSKVVGYVGRLQGVDWHQDWEYSPSRAQLRAEHEARRPKATKLSQHPRLAAEVQVRLDRHDSPEQIAHRLKIDFPDDQEMRVSHETIYVSLYVQGRGELRRDLHQRLRTGRAVRKPRRRTGERRGARIKDMVNISQRPAEVEDRAVPGHWEGDLIMGSTASNSAIGTLVERTTRFVMLLHLPNGHGADAVQEAMVEAMSRLPQTLRRTLTWDQGTEMANHVQIAAATELDIYFCDPHSPWQRGSNENTNGLLRQYFPKGTDLSGYHPEYLEFVANQLNNRPRKTLGWLTPAEALDQLLSNPPSPPVAVTA